MPDVRRREVIALLGGGAAAWPLAARAQQSARTPVVGLLSSESRSAFAHRLDGFHRGLAEGGYVEDQNVIFEYRWAEARYDRVPALAADLVRQKVSVIVANYPPVLEAKKATDTMPIIFTSAADPVEIGLVASLNRPGANVTGIYLVAQALEAKRLDLLNKLVTAAASIGVLVNPNFRDTDRQLHELQDAATGLKRKLQILRATNNDEIDTAFAAAADERLAGLLVISDPFFARRRNQLVALAARYKLPAIYNSRGFAESGGLITYGSDFADAYRLAGNYVGKVLQGAKPADLPIVQPTKFELVINLTTAKSLGLTMPDQLLALADEVIE
jgi:putative tryptophan/tyrosine transport system substrate-binding protein